MVNEKLVARLKSQEEEHYKLLDRMAELDHNTFIIDARIEGKIIGFKKGFKEGFKKSFKKRFKEILKKNKATLSKKEFEKLEAIVLKEAEEKADIEIVLRLSNDNVSILRISGYTGLSIEKIERILMENKEI
ncbi:MAG: hypothetical protein LBM96_09385 [Methanobrevibacter sp.]|jgi:hypothetical protein|nr:hypothetical protein [Candidatus Methanoflexus mossambicus]